MKKAKDPAKKAEREKRRKLEQRFDRLRSRGRRFLVDGADLNLLLAYLESSEFMETGALEISAAGHNCFPITLPPEDRKAFGQMIVNATLAAREKVHAALTKLEPILAEFAETGDGEDSDEDEEDDDY